MPFFKLKAGTHQEEGDGHIYTKGEIVESPYNLTKMFGKDKFQLTDEKPKHAVDEDADELDRDYYKPSTPKAERGPTAPPESPREEERRKERGEDLDFATERRKTRKGQTSQKTRKGKTSQTTKTSKVEDSELGEDVTDQFDGCGENFKVFRKGKKYFITDTEDEVLHEDEITTKDMVETTLEEWNEEYES